MHEAAASGSIDIMHALSKHGANMFTQLSNGCTPIDVFRDYCIFIDSDSDEEPEEEREAIEIVELIESRLESTRIVWMLRFDMYRLLILLVLFHIYYTILHFNLIIEYQFEVYSNLTLPNDLYLAQEVSF